MTWRPLKETDLEECLALYPRIMGHELIGHDHALRAWRTLIRHPSCNFAVVEFKKSSLRRKIVGFGASAFVSRAFAEEEIARPRPGLNARIMSSIAAGASVVLSEAELRKANTYDGLNLVVLCGAWRRNLLTDAQIREVKMHLSWSFLELHSGYRLVRLLIEATDQADIDHGYSTGVHRMVSNFAEYHRRNPGRWNQDRALFVLDRESAFSVTASIATILFHYSEPTLGLRKEDQQLLTAALTGMTDEELCERLNLQLGALKKRWAALFRRVVRTRPEILSELEDTTNRLTRGRQKRHHLLGYIRQHPEELRPVLTRGPAFSGRRGHLRGASEGRQAKRNR